MSMMMEDKLVFIVALVVSPSTRLRHQFPTPEQTNLTIADLRSQTPTDDYNSQLDDLLNSEPWLLMAPGDCGQRWRTWRSA